MKHNSIPAAAILVAAGFAVAALVTHALAEEVRAVASNRAELITRVQSHSWSVRHAAIRELRELKVDDAPWLAELAAHNDPQVRAVALDVLSLWSRESDQTKRVTARDTLTAISVANHAGSNSASARLDAIHGEVERTALVELAANFHPGLEMT